MARLLKKYRRYYIKETTPRDNTLYSHYVCLPDDYNFVDWECSSLQEAIDFIDSKLDDE